MRVAFLSFRNVVHTVRWVNSLSQYLEEIHLISSHEGGDSIDSKVRFHKLPFSAPQGYFLNYFKLKSLLDEIKPDLINTHFASGYGTLARLVNFSPNILSVWGADVYDFPEKSFLHKKIIQNNLKKADWICSTSHVMAQKTRDLYPVENISVTPFGIDVEKFSPREKQNHTSNEIVIGTVKTLSPKYGIDILIKSFAYLRENISSKYSGRLRLQIVGEGEQEDELKKMTDKLGLSEVVTFIGRVPHGKVPKYLNKFDIYAALSRLDSESFGVAILEASSCGLPVVVSDVGGLPEVVNDGKTGFVVRSENYKMAARKLKELVLRSDLKRRMGRNGRKHVLRNYKWETCVDNMLSVYEKVLGKKK